MPAANSGGVVQCVILFLPIIHLPPCALPNLPLPRSHEKHVSTRSHKYMYRRAPITSVQRTEHTEPFTSCTPQLLPV